VRARPRNFELRVGAGRVGSSIAVAAVLLSRNAPVRQAPIATQVAEQRDATLRMELRGDVGARFRAGVNSMACAARAVAQRRGVLFRGARHVASFFVTVGDVQFV